MHWKARHSICYDHGTCVSLGRCSQGSTEGAEVAQSGEMSSTGSMCPLRHGPLWRGLAPGKPGHLGSEPLPSGTTVEHLAVAPDNWRRERANSSGFPEALADCLCPVRVRQAQETHRTRRTRRARRGLLSSAILQSGWESWALPATEPPSDHSHASPSHFFCN